MSDRLALANAIEDAGIPRDKAQRVASVISTPSTITSQPRPMCRPSAAT